MDIKFTEEQEIIRQSARDFLTSRFPKSLAREIVDQGKEFPKDLWREMADLGWMGLVLPEKYGGTGGKILDLAVLLEEMGRACLQGPFFTSAIVGGFCILETGNEQQKQELLPKIACGDIIVVLALIEPEADYEPSALSVTARPKGNYYIIDGTKLFVPYADVADYIIVVARTGKGTNPEDGITLFLINNSLNGIRRTQLDTVSRDKQFEIVFDDVKVSKENVLGEANKGWTYIKKILLKAGVAKCAEMTGGAQQVLDMTVAYAKERVQFGKPIGSFQAIQHHCVNMLVDVEGCRWVTYKAACMMDENQPYEQQAAIAKALCSQAYGRVVGLGHQVIGGVSYILDHDMPLYFRHARGAEADLGDEEFFKKIVADGLYNLIK